MGYPVTVNVAGPSGLVELTLTVTEALVLFVLDTGLVVDIVAVFVTEVAVVTVGAVTVMTTNVLEPAASVPSEAVTVPLIALEHEPTVTEQETKVRLEGNGSDTVTFCAAAVPMF